MPYITSVERIGIEQGIEQGQRRLLVHQIQTRFGVEYSDEAASILGQVHEPAQLDQVGDWIVECQTEAELLGRLKVLVSTDR